MKRPPGLWILLSAGVLWLCLQDVYGIRATALIFGKSSTSTTTEAITTTSAEETGNTTESSTSVNATENGNSTSPVLTGNPQIDYIWDPNLPKELNGYNLSEYPFYERVPDEVIEFKCDGLHDGFYASIPHKCQVYHHCLFGTRYDFLCANYTAFDQKTFICQFVSVVDCVNSKKFWHRNDALYKSESTTTTAAPNLRAAIYTTAPPDGGEPITPRRPAGGGARRPYRPTRRRRPQVEYYDDEYYDDEYYDERPRANRGRKRPKPRPRPVYEDDDYEEYEDERYESRRGGGRRRPYRDRRRNKDKRKPEYDEDDEPVDEKFEDEDFIKDHKRQKNDDRPKRPVNDDDDDENRKRPSEKRRPSSATNREQSSDYDRKPTRKGSGNRRPVYDEYEDELPQSDDSRSYEDRPRKKPKGNKQQQESSDGRPIIKSATGTIYDRPRVAPRINLPVPKNAADKFAYKAIGGNPTTTTTTSAPPAEEEEYEEYEDPLPKRSNNQGRRPSNVKNKSTNEDSKSQPSGSRLRPTKFEPEEVVEKTTAKPRYSPARNRYRQSSASKRKPPVSQEYEDEEYADEDVQEKRPSQKNEKKPITTTTTTTEPPKKEKHEPIMRIIKRPFLPSRGGSPYSARGLQPVGLKAVPENEAEEDRSENLDVEEEDDYTEEERPAKSKEDNDNRKPYFKPSPVLYKVPMRQKYTPPSADAQELIDSEPSRQQTYKTKEFTAPRTTQKPKLAEKNPLDLNEYDVTLNDALNPTLPNLPVRAFPTGFSSASDYNYNSFSRPRYVIDPNYVHLNNNNNNKFVRSHQRYEEVPQGQYSTINTYRQPPQPGQTQALYSSY